MECQCSLRTRLVGDGCQACNPTLAAEIAADAGKCWECEEPASGEGPYPELCAEHGASLHAESMAAAEAYGKPPCQECRAMTLEEAQERCICGGDKDDCHGTKLWPD